MHVLIDIQVKHSGKHGKHLLFYLNIWGGQFNIHYEVTIFKTYGLIHEEQSLG